MEAGLGRGQSRRSSTSAESLGGPDRTRQARRRQESPRRRPRIEVGEAKFEKIPQTTVRLEGRHAETMLKLYEALEEHEDVQEVWANFDIPDEVMERAE